MDNFLQVMLIVLFSSVFLFLLFLIGYKLSCKLTFKRAIIRISFMLISIAISVLITKYMTNLILYLNLKDIGLAFTIKGVEYKMLIDLLEEIIIYNKLFVTVYEFFPSLKELFLEFPKLLVTPFIYVFVCFAIYMLLYPLYLYISFEENKKAFNTKKSIRKKSVAAGFAGGIQAIFLFSIILTPINGYNRAYQQAIKSNLSDKKSLCEQIETLGQFQKVCDMIGLYNLTIFAKMSGENSIDQFIYNELTSTKYGNTTTNIEKEIALIVRSSVVLDQSGLIFYLNGNASQEALGAIDLNMLGDNNINIVLDSVSKSKYTNGIIADIIEFLIKLLNEKLIQASHGSGVRVDIKIANDEMANEVRVIFETLEYAAENNALDITHIDFENKKISEMVANFDVDVLVNIFKKILNSKIFSAFLPMAINLSLSQLGIHADPDENYDLNHDFELVGEVAKLMVKYKTDDFIEILSGLKDEDRPILAEILNGVTKSKLFIDTLDVLFENIKGEIELTTRMLKDVTNWENEVDILISAVKILVDYQKGNGVNLVDLYNAVKLMKNSELATPIIKSFVRKKIIDIKYEIFEAIDWIYYWDRQEIEK